MPGAGKVKELPTHSAFSDGQQAGNPLGCYWNHSGCPPPFSSHQAWFRSRKVWDASSLLVTVLASAAFPGCDSASACLKTGDRLADLGVEPGARPGAGTPEIHTAFGALAVGSSAFRYLKGSLPRGCCNLLLAC